MPNPLPDLAAAPVLAPVAPPPGSDGSGGGARPVHRVTSAPSGFEGNGFPVRRAFAGVPLAELDPFIHMDQMGEVDYAPGEPKGTPWHPHRGFETVTYLLDGRFEHRDSIGGGGLIGPGDTQWMTAGAGILHIERPPEDLVASGGRFHGIQLWVNLPGAKKMTAPRYQDLLGDRIPVLTNTARDAAVRLIAGRLGDTEGCGSTHTPIAMVHASVLPGARLVLPWNAAHNALAYVLAGSGTVGADRVAVSTGQLIVLGAGDTVVADASSSAPGPLELLVLGGEPIREPVAAHGPFVMNTREELVRAFEDFQAGRLGTVPADDRDA